jgi:TonB family protein
VSKIGLALGMSLIAMPRILFAAPSPALQIGGSISERDYPKDALKRGIEGDVQVSFLVSAKGKVENCKGYSPDSDQNLVSGSCEVVNRFKFRPARAENGNQIDEQRSQSFAWHIHSACPPSPAAHSICVNLERRRK